MIPEIALAVGFLVLVTILATRSTFGITAPIVGLITFQPPYAVVTVRARLLMNGRRDEEAAHDLGTLPLGAVRRVLLPMLYPAILVNAILSFAGALDTCIIVGYLSAGRQRRDHLDAHVQHGALTYNTGRATPTAALDAFATLILVASFPVAGLGWFSYRRWGKGQGHESSLSAITSSM